MLFRPFRTLILLALTFFAGVMFERNNANEQCLEIGGTPTNSLCPGASK